MVAVTYSARVAATAPAVKANPARKGFFARLMTAMMDARLRQASREIELHQHLLHDWKSAVKDR